MPCLVIHASSALAATLYAVIVSSWYGRFCLLVRERSQSQNSLIIIARSASPDGGSPAWASRPRLAARAGGQQSRAGRIYGERMRAVQSLVQFHSGGAAHT
jgi:hypothetical protein